MGAAFPPPVTSKAVDERPERVAQPIGLHWSTAADAQTASAHSTGKNLEEKSNIPHTPGATKRLTLKLPFFSPDKHERLKKTFTCCP